MSSENNNDSVNVQETIKTKTRQDNNDTDLSIDDLESINSYILENPEEKIQPLHSGHKSNNNYKHKSRTSSSSTGKKSNSSDNENTANENNNKDPVFDDNSIKKTTTKLSKAVTSLSVKFDKSKVVPRGQRRGILANLSIIPEYENARELPNNIKYLIVLIIAICAIVGPMGTSILLPAIDDVADDLDTTVTIVNMSVGIYLLALGIFPLWWSSFSERHGRRSIYIISFTMFFGFSIGAALSKNIGMLIGFRILCGASSASVQAVGAGTISDLYDIKERGAAMGIYYLGPLGGPLLAPIIGGAVAQGWGWRATQWFLVIIAGFSLILVIFVLPETLRSQENREAIRKILRSRRRDHHINDEENQTTKPKLNDNSPVRSSDDTNNLETFQNRALDEKNDGDDNNSNEDEDEDDYDSLEDESLDNERIDKILSRLSRQPTAVQEDIEFAVGCESVPFDKSVSYSETGKDPKEIKRKAFNKLKRLVLRIDKDEIKNNSKENKDIQESFMKKFKRNSYIYGYAPLKSLVFFKCPLVFLAVAYSAPCFAILYFVNMTLSYCYARPPYNFSSVILGLVYIPNSVTYLIASIWGGKFTDKLLEKKRIRDGSVAPEARFGVNVLIAVIIFPISLLITGWCLDKGEHWVTPLIGTALFGFASMIIIGVTVTYLVDSLPGRGATGVALNNFVRQLLATVACFVTEPLIKALTVGVLFSILAGIITLFAGILIILKKKGDHWRETYDLERLYDIVDD